MMREVSDRLCKEYGLSIIKKPQRGKTRHIGEIKAEMEGRPRLGEELSVRIWTSDHAQFYLSAV